MVKKMQNKQFRLSYFIVIILIGVLVFGLGFTACNKKAPSKVYQINLDGQVLGVVSDKNTFEKYINQKEEAIMKKYGVDKVYMPNGVTIKAVTTYNSRVDSDEEV